jgi:hypothetical protein
MVDFHGAKIASFTIRGRRMLCLPQATEHFLKDLVGGPHTVYCKCKRLEIYPIPCNVDQVLILSRPGFLYSAMIPTYQDMWLACKVHSILISLPTATTFYNLMLE